MKNKTILLLVVIAIVMIGMTLVSIIKKPVTDLEELTLEDKRQTMLIGLMDNIEEMKLEGNYDCCIEPACTMCYLGNWMWEDGKCLCDQMMKEGNLDKVCPQCLKGLEEGRCKNSEEACQVDI